MPHMSPIGQRIQPFFPAVSMKIAHPAPDIGALLLVVLWKPQCLMSSESHLVRYAGQITPTIMTRIGVLYWHSPLHRDHRPGMQQKTFCRWTLLGDKTIYLLLWFHLHTLRWRLPSSFSQSNIVQYKCNMNQCISRTGENTLCTYVHGDVSKFGYPNGFEGHKFRNDRCLLWLPW